MKSTFFSSISTKILLCVIFIGAVVTSLFSSITIYFDYIQDKEKVEKRLNEINKSNLDSILNSVWNLDYTQIDIALKGLVHLDDIEYVLIRDKNKVISEVGKRVKYEKISRIYPLKYKLKENKYEHIGDIYIEASLENVHKRVVKKAILAFFAELVRITLFGFSLLILIKFLLTRHIKSITDFFAEGNITTNNELKLVRTNELFHEEDDEIDTLVSSINLMKKNLNDEFSQRKMAQKKLEILNRNLEKQVEDRSAMLLESNKYAAIGEMAAGVAHEINSPLSTVYGSTKRMLKLFNTNGEVDPTHAKELLHSQINTLNRIFMITKGLRALSNSSIVQDYTKINLKHMIEEMMGSIEEIFRSRGVSINYLINNCDTEVDIQQEKIYQLLFNIISFRTNMLTDEYSPWIKLAIEYSESQLIIRLYDSIGELNESEISVLNDPFVKKEGIARGSHLELNSIKPLLDALDADLVLNGSEDNLIMTINLLVAQR